MTMIDGQSIPQMLQKLITVQFDRLRGKFMFPDYVNIENMY